MCTELNCIYILTYKDADSDWKLDVFASLITEANYSKSSTVITA
jgi:hypothetical protein